MNFSLIFLPLLSCTLSGLTRKAQILQKYDDTTWLLAKRAEKIEGKQYKLKLDAQIDQ